jgi:hypothetical protein
MDHAGASQNFRRKKFQHENLNPTLPTIGGLAKGVVCCGFPSWRQKFTPLPLTATVGNVASVVPMILSTCSANKELLRRLNSLSGGVTYWLHVPDSADRLASCQQRRTNGDFDLRESC